MESVSKRFVNSRPGGWLRYHANGKIEEGIYWKLPAPADNLPKDSPNRRRAITSVQTFDEAVQMRLISDVRWELS